MSPNAPERWNPQTPLNVTPIDYERQVIQWLRQEGATITGLEVKNQTLEKGQSGEYTLDGLASFEVFGGAVIRILVECKRHRRPIEREVILGVSERLREVSGQKAMVFSTAGFQRGAIEYATKNGIALIMFVDGRATYFTRSNEKMDERHYPSDLPRFVGQLIREVGKNLSVSTIAREGTHGLADWLNEWA